MALVVSEAQITKWVQKKRINKLINAYASVGGDKKAEKKISEALIGLGKPVVEPFLKACGKQRYIGIRANDRYDVLANIYKTSRDEEVFDRLLRALKPTSKGWVENAAAMALGMTGDMRAEDPLLRRMAWELEKYPNYTPSGYVAALGSLKSGKAVPLLMRTLVVWGNEKGYVQDKVVGALVSIGGPSIVPLLAGGEDPRPAYREACLKALKKLKKIMTEAQLGDFERLSTPVELEIKRGGFGEPYCSDSCFKRGAEHIMAVAANQPPAQCSSCGRKLSRQEYTENTFGFIPFEGKTLFVCAACAEEAALQLKHYKKCVVCQRQI